MAYIIEGDDIFDNHIAKSELEERIPVMINEYSLKDYRIMPENLNVI